MPVYRLASVAVLALAVIIARPSAAFAQSSGVGVGLKAGPTYASFDGDNLDLKNKTGWHVGMFFGGNRDGVFGLQCELNWIRKETEGNTGDVRVDYINLPVMLRLNIGTYRTKTFDLYGLVGPSFSFKVADEIEGVTIDDGFEGSDIGLVFGGGVEITRLILEARYEKGFRNINRNFQSLSDIKTQTFTVLIGVRFN